MQGAGAMHGWGYPVQGLGLYMDGGTLCRGLGAGSSFPT